MSIISTHHLSIGYAKGKAKALIQSNLDLELRQGEMVCLIGPNGSGKSTLLRTLAGLQKPLSGDILIDNKDITGFSSLEKALQIALVLTDKVEIEKISWLL